MTTIKASGIAPKTMPRTPHLAGHWGLDEGGGTTLVDKSANGYDLDSAGTVAGGFYSTVPGAGTFSVATEEFFGAHSALHLGNKSFILSARFKMPAIPGQATTIVSRINTATPWAGYWFVLLNSTGYLRMEVRTDDNTGPFNLVAGVNYCDNVEHRIIAAIDVTSERHLYIDGAVTPSETAGVTDMLSANLVKSISHVDAEMGIGSRGNTATNLYPYYDATSGPAQIYDVQLYIPPVGDGLASNFLSEILPWMWLHPDQAIPASLWS